MQKDPAKKSSSEIFRRVFYTHGVMQHCTLRRSVQTCKQRNPRRTFFCLFVLCIQYHRAHAFVNFIIVKVRDDYLSGIPRIAFWTCSWTKRENIFPQRTQSTRRAPTEGYGFDGFCADLYLYRNPLCPLCVVLPSFSLHTAAAVFLHFHEHALVLHCT